MATADDEYDRLKRPFAPPVQPILATVPHQSISRVMAIVLIFGYFFSISGMLMTHGSILSWGFFITVLAVNARVYTPVESPSPPAVRDEGRRFLPDVDDGMKKEKSPSDLLARLLDQALGGHQSIAIEVWNDFGWVVEKSDSFTHWNMSKKNVVISDSNAIMVDGHKAWTRYNDKIYVPGVWAQYVLSDLKQIAEEVANRIGNARRLEKINRYLVVRERRERARILALAVNDVELFAGWDEEP